MFATASSCRYSHWRQHSGAQSDGTDGMVVMDWGGLALIGTGLGLGLRHGIDWDHIAAITDITGTTTTESDVTARDSTEARAVSNALALVATSSGNPATGDRQFWSSGSPPMASTTHLTLTSQRPAWWPSADARGRFFLATLYALGHALVVVILGLLAIWASEILPGWIDPIMERIVGVTLLLLGLWIVYQLWQYGRDFRLRSRWMIVFSVVGGAWARLKSRVTGHEHRHSPIEQYGKRTAFGIGLIHGIGAETGSQALLLAGTAGATTRFAGSVLLTAFVVGLLFSNSLIAALSTFGFVSSQTRKNVYFVIGIIAAVFSIGVGALFVTGQGASLPDLAHLMRAD